MQHKQLSISAFFQSTPRSNNKNKPAERPCKKRERSSDTPSLEKYFTSNSNKRANVEIVMQQRSAFETEAVIGITYRDDGAGKGAFFDHRTIQLAVEKPTAVLNSATLPNAFARHIRENQNLLQFGIHIDKTHFKFPPLHFASDAEIGLIVIPGVSKNSFKTSAYQVRKNEEMTIIKQALYRGQPVLAICGGSWVLYESFGGTLRHAKGHNYRGGMPRLNANTATPTHNKDLHRLELTGNNTLLQAALQYNDADQHLAVNSVHFRVPNEAHVPAALCVSAKAIPDAALAPANSKAAEKSIEAFETIHGVPVLGIQWHPEAYDANTHHARMLRYMEKAGQRYLNHRQVLAEFTHHVTNQTIALRPTHQFTNTLQCIKRTYPSHSMFFLRNGSSYEALRHVDELQHELRCKEDYLHALKNR